VKWRRKEVRGKKQKRKQKQEDEQASMLERDIYMYILVGQFGEIENIEGSVFACPACIDDVVPLPRGSRFSSSVHDARLGAECSVNCKVSNLTRLLSLMIQAQSVIGRPG
jgi:hypothetical protein